MTTLSPAQEAGVRTIVSRLKGVISPPPLTYLAGYAGTGKSTILPDLLEASGFSPEKVGFMAPTGKAAKVMRSKLKAQGYPNCNAGTIHSAIYRAKPAPIGTLENELYAAEEEAQRARYEAGFEADPGGVTKLLQGSHHYALLLKTIERLKAELANAYREDKISFQLNHESLVKELELIVVDEASMVGRNMANDLMFFEVPVLAIGDPGQLPPVQDEPGLTAGEPDVFLSEIHRQAKDNPILHLATLARTGQEVPLGDYGDGVRVIRRRDMVDDFESDPQVLVGTNNMRWRINRNFRQGMPRSPVAGEPLIICKNSRQHPNLVNGSPVRALADAEMIEGRATFEMPIEDEDGVKYDAICFQGLFEETYLGKGVYTAPDQAVYRAKGNAVVLDWSYAITVHKSQGSQWDDVVLYDESSTFRADADRWLYTGITRAAKRLTILV